MSSGIQDFYKNKSNYLYFKYYGPNDLATLQDVKTISKNQKQIKELMSINKAIIKTIDEFACYLLAIKLVNLSELVSLLKLEKDREVIREISQKGEEVVNKTDRGSVTKYINGHIEEIIGNKKFTSDFEEAFFDYMFGCKKVIEKETWFFLIEKRKNIIINNYSKLSKDIFEKNPDLFEALFPNGELEMVFSIYEDEILSIFKQILKKDNSVLKTKVKAKVDFMYEKLTKIGDDGANILQNEHLCRLFLEFLRETGNPKANIFSNQVRSLEKDAEKYILENGKSFQYEIPIGEILSQWRLQENWEIRLLSLTHMVTNAQQKYKINSVLSKYDKLNTAMDYFGSRVSTNNFFTSSHLDLIQININVYSGIILVINKNDNDKREFLCLLRSAIEAICEFMPISEQFLIREDTDVLISFIQTLDFNDVSKNNKAAYYGIATYACAFLEKMLRVFYRFLVGDSKYIPDNITLKDLISTNNIDIKGIFGENHLKHLAYFLLDCDKERIGLKYRNKLAHLDGDIELNLNIQFVAKILWIFTDVVNTIFAYFLELEINKEK